MVEWGRGGRMVEGWGYGGGEFVKYAGLPSETCYNILLKTLFLLDFNAHLIRMTIWWEVMESKDGLHYWTPQNNNVSM